MSPSEHPETPPEPSETPATTGIQTPSNSTAPREAPSISLPPLPQTPAMDSAQLLRLNGRLDAVLVAVVLLFAFLVASFPVASPDFFRQLATGRLLLEGEYHFGVDPFVYSAAESDYFVNHSWLFALLMYGLYHLPTVGSSAVVIFKALVVVALAEILLRASRRPGQGLWIPAACTALAILVLSPRLFLQSTCLSLLFLGATFWLLTARRSNGRPFWWLLPLLFALWVNCDQWFFLGPLTAALYLVGELGRLRLDGTSVKPQAAQHELSTLAIVLVVGLAACLLNPHHVHAFTLPPELGLTPASELIAQEPQFHALFLSPLRKDYYEPNLGLSVAGLAYWPLLLLGLASFVFTYGRAPWGRLLVWIGFVLLSFYNMRTIPFFAVVAGPITALNWLDYASQRLGAEPRLTPAWLRWSLGGRVLTIVLGLALVIAAVPGWLQSQPWDLRRLGWSVRVDPSLKAMAQTIQEWRQAGLLGDREPHWFNMQYEVGNYLAWFAPGERVFLDQGLPYSRKAAEEYAALRQELKTMSEQRLSADRERAIMEETRNILHKLHARYWICDNRGNDKPSLFAQMILFSRPEEWVLCHLKGRIAIFAWHDPQESEAPDPSRGLALDLKRVAFGPTAEPAPPRGPELASSRSWWETCWDVWWRPAPLPSLDREGVPLYAVRFQVAEKPRQIEVHSRAWQAGVAAGAIAGSLPRGPVPNNLLALSWSCTYHDLFPPGAAQPVRPIRRSELLAMKVVDFYVNRQFFEAPSLYLGVRAARRALLVNPENTITYLQLGQAYQQLGGLPHERTLFASVPRLAAIRRTQMVSAFQNCLRFQPNLEIAAQAHEALFSVFAQIGYIDAAAHHLRETLDTYTAAGPSRGTSAEQHSQKLDALSKDLDKLEANLERRRNSYDVRSASKLGLEKVKIALELGLPETALTALEEAAEAKISTPADMDLVKQVTGVALDLGRLDRAQELLIPDPESMADQPVRPDYLDLHVRLAAGRGDYAEADRLLAEALRHGWKPPPGTMVLRDPIRGTAEAIGRVLLAEKEPQTGNLRFPSPIHDLPSSFWLRLWRIEAVANGLSASLEQSELNMMRGWLALETGHCAEARKSFQTVRDTSVLGVSWLPAAQRVKGRLIPEQEIAALKLLGRQHQAMHALSKGYLKWLVD
ncbi:MAG TPA: hypothetical protein VMG10_36595 [Gemmataceae bacterium]|nr:hypothetical protein [Gemmataceae bacterium]